MCEIHSNERRENSQVALELLPQERVYRDNVDNSNFPTSLYFKTVRGVISEYGQELLVRSPNEGCTILRNSSRIPTREVAIGKKYQQHR